MYKKIGLSLLVGILLLPHQLAMASTHSKSLQDLGFNDVMFAQAMIPHHKQAIVMSEMALKQSKNQEILKLSRSIINAQKAEVSQMSYWLKATKSSMTMDHEMHMSGMLTQKELGSLRKLTGQKFDRTFLDLMIKHHQGALEMVDLLTGTKNAEAKQLAREIRSVQKSEISNMKNLLTKIK